MSKYDAGALGGGWCLYPHLYEREPAHLERPGEITYIACLLHCQTDIKQRHYVTQRSANSAFYPHFYPDE